MMTHAINCKEHLRTTWCSGIKKYLTLLLNVVNICFQIIINDTFRQTHGIIEAILIWAKI